MKISVLGAGGWGTTLAILLKKNGNNVTLWEFNKEYADTISEYRENFYFLPKVRIPKDIHITSDISEALGKSEIVVVAVPTQYIRRSFSSIRGFDMKQRCVISVSKGIENKTNMLVSDILHDIFKIRKNRLCSLSGPSHAEEVSRRVPTAVVCASDNLKTACSIASVFSNDYFRVYASDDLVGTELGGALKNVIAIAAGITDGAGFGDNTKAALMTRGITEIMRLGMLMKARRETFFGLSGIGDLIVTCSSKHSRNRYVGEQIGKGKSLKYILDHMKMVAEGVATTKSVHELGKKFNIELPIADKVYRILFKNVSPNSAMKDLMTRSIKTEHTVKGYNLT